MRQAAKRRANGEGSIRKRSDGRWEGRYTAGHDENGKAIMLKQQQKENEEGWPDSPYLFPSPVTGGNVPPGVGGEPSQKDTEGGRPGAYPLPRSATYLRNPGLTERRRCENRLRHALYEKGKADYERDSAEALKESDLIRDNAIWRRNLIQQRENEPRDYSL